MGVYCIASSTVNCLELSWNCGRRGTTTSIVSFMAMVKVWFSLHVENRGEFGGRRRTKDEEERIDLRRGLAAGLEPVACRRVHEQL